MPSPCARSGSGTIHVAQAPGNHHQLPGQLLWGPLQLMPTGGNAAL